MNTTHECTAHDTGDATGTLGRLGEALASPTRQRILLSLMFGPAYPSQLAADQGRGRPAISNHLACLRGCGLVSTTTEGRRTRYELADPRIADALRILLSVDLGAHADACTSSIAGGAR